VHISSFFSRVVGGIADKIRSNFRISMRKRRAVLKLKGCRCSALGAAEAHNEGCWISPRLLFTETCWRFATARERIEFSCHQWIELFPFCLARLASFGVSAVSVPLICCFVSPVLFICVRKGGRAQSYRLGSSLSFLPPTFKLSLGDLSSPDPLYVFLLLA